MKNKSNQLRLFVKVETGKKFEDCKFKFLGVGEQPEVGFIRAKKLKLSEEGYILNAEIRDSKNRNKK